MTVTITSNVINLYLNAALIYGSEGVDLFFRETLPSLSFLKMAYCILYLIINGSHKIGNYQVKLLEIVKNGGIIYGKINIGVVASV